MSNPRLPRGFGFGGPQATLPPPPTDDSNLRTANAVEAIRDRTVLPTKHLKVAINLTSGTNTVKQLQNDVINSITVTVMTGELWIFVGISGSISSIPDYKFTAGDTRQLALPPNTYDFQFYANGATTTGTVYLSAV